MTTHKRTSFTLLVALVVPISVLVSACSSPTAEEVTRTDAQTAASSTDKTEAGKESAAKTTATTSTDTSKTSTTSSAATSTSESDNTTDLDDIDDRTSAVVFTDDETYATDNAKEARPGLSVLKLYIADYALRKGEISDEDFALAQRMITQSDDFAADVLFQKYPQSIDWVAQDYELENTTSSTRWGAALTSAYDVAKYLDKVQQTRPNSFIMKWMTSPRNIATDGTKQEWGTAQLPGAKGTKWGWSDFGRKSVASATFGDDFTAAAFTWGSADTQDQDMKKLLPQIEK